MIGRYNYLDRPTWQTTFCYQWKQDGDRMLEIIYCNSGLSLNNGVGLSFSEFYNTLPKSKFCLAFFVVVKIYK